MYSNDYYTNEVLNNQNTKFTKLYENPQWYVHLFLLTFYIGYSCDFSKVLFKVTPIHKYICLEVF